MLITFDTTSKSTKENVIIHLLDNSKKVPDNSPLAKHISFAIDKSPAFKWEEGQHIELLGADVGHVLLVSVGDLQKISPLNIKNLGGKITDILHSKKLTAATIFVPENKLFDAEIIANLAYGVALKNYSFNKYYVNKKADHSLYLSQVEFVTKEAAAATTFYHSLSALVEGVHLARNLVSEPANILYPESFAERCMQLTALGVKVMVLDEKAMASEGMNALLGVGKGSDQPSKAVIMEWSHGSKQDKPLALVGKGVCFDSGGLDIKPSSGMVDMKQDMAGAAAVVGAMHALASSKVHAHVVGIIGLVENMVSGRAQRPGDVVVSMSGQTVEIDNTDAEGRLVLCDIMWYVQQYYKPSHMIDIATLTGAVVVALGENIHAGLLSNDDVLAEQLLELGKKNGELLWRLPLAAAYDKQIDSEIADIRNTGSGRGGGSITAAQFLQRFVQDGCKWAHLDIANVEWNKKGGAISPKGATGFGVNLLVDFVRTHTSK